MSDQPRPNVIWFFGDQHRAQTVSHAGDPNVATPNIDRLAAQGVVADGVSGCPLCCPYRGSLLTSRYPHEAVPGHERQMPPELPTVATAFNDAGYHTAWFGKWHLDGWRERDGRSALHTVPRDRRGGFAQWLGYDNNNSPWDCLVHGHDGAGDEIERYRLPTFETDALTDLAIDMIRGRREGDQPYFCVVSVQPPHDPYMAPERWQQRHRPADVTLRPNVPDIPAVHEQARRELAGYHAMVENLDWNLGRLREALADAGQLDQTHLVFFSDHGDMHGSHGMFRKTNPYEESIRVPMIFGGGVPRYGYKVFRSDALINHVDLAPTSLGLCGIDPPDWMRGTDYSHLRCHDRPAKDVPDSAYLSLVEPTLHGHSTDRPWRGLVTRDGWKYVCLEHQPWLLFNLNDDPYEQV
ncbi:MAG: sulfatase, partial [Planctomycetota bacterium]